MMLNRQPIVALIFLMLLLLSERIQAKVAQRIVALSPHSVELLYAIGAGERIVGTVEYADYPKAALEIPRIGSYAGIQIEKLVKLEADLVVGWKSGNKLADLKKIESLGLNLVYSHPKNIQEVISETIALGKLTGLEKNAERVANEIQSSYQIIRDQYAKKQPIKVFYQLWDDPLRSIGPGSWVESMIADCNGINIFNDTANPYPIVSLENVLTKNPEVIIIQHHSKTDAKDKIWQHWTMLDAVKNKQLHTIDPDLLLRPTPRAILGLRLLCEAIDRAR